MYLYGIWSKKYNQNKSKDGAGQQPYVYSYDMAGLCQMTTEWLQIDVND